MLKHCKPLLPWCSIKNKHTSSFSYCSSSFFGNVYIFRQLKWRRRKTKSPLTYLFLIYLHVLKLDQTCLATAKKLSHSFFHLIARASLVQQNWYWANDVSWSQITAANFSEQLRFCFEEIVFWWFPIKVLRKFRETKHATHFSLRGSYVVLNLFIKAFSNQILLYYFVWLEKSTTRWMVTTEYTLTGTLRKIMNDYRIFSQPRDHCIREVQIFRFFSHNFRRSEWLGAITIGCPFTFPAKLFPAFVKRCLRKNIIDFIGCCS